MFAEAVLFQFSWPAANMPLLQPIFWDLQLQGDAQDGGGAGAKSLWC